MPYRAVMKSACRSIFSQFLRCACLSVFSSHVALAQSGEWSNFSGGRSRQLSVLGNESNAFRLVDPGVTGVQFTNRLAQERGATNRTLYNGSGVATGDIDGDGLVDLVFAGIENQVVLFKNLGGWNFSNITFSSGVRTTNLNCRGVNLADIDGDNALDLLVTANHVGVLCWRGDGKGKFIEMTREAGTYFPFGSLTTALADIDGNGSLDLYVANNRSEDIRDQGEVKLSLVGGKRTVPAALRNRLVLFEDQVLEYGEPDVLLLNDGRGRFRQAVWSNTFRDEAGKPLPGAPLDWGLSAAFRDLNGDRAPDLYVCNDFWTPDRIWLNEGNGNFRAAPPLAFRQTSASSMGVDTADLNFDGSPEVFVLDMLSRSAAARKRQMEAQRSFPNLPGVFTDRPQSLRNTLFLSRRDGTYAEIANLAGLAASEWAWQPIFLDADLDGHPDLLITSGHVQDVQDRDANLLIRARGRNYQSITNRDERRRAFIADMVANSLLYPPLKTPIVAFRNRGDLSFEDVTDKWGTALPGVHHGIATGDFDGDGDLDFAVNNLSAAATLYRNDFSKARVAVRLQGKKPNSQAIGAKVMLRGGAVPEQWQEITSGGRYLSGCDPLVVFGAGTSKTNMSLEITWRDGTRRIVSNVEANRYYEINQDSSLDLKQEQPSGVTKQPQFSDVSPRLGHIHHEALFDDFARQPLLPHRLSQQGPGVSWIDLDRDGWDDLVIGTGAGGSLGVYRNDQKGGFSRWTNAPFDQAFSRDTTTAINLPTHQSKSSVLVGLSSYEDARTNAALIRFDIEMRGLTAVLPDFSSSIGPLSAADFDGDHDLDLFAGARVIPGQWPRSGASHLIEKHFGKWNLRPLPGVTNATNATELPVSASLWTDLNSDGFPELVLAGEFGPVRIFKNNRGSLEPSEWTVLPTNGHSVPLEQITGWWTSLSAGDFDGDGQMDLVAGNWGINSEYKASQARPLKFYAGAFPGSPYFGTVETTFDTGLNTYVPTRPLDDFYSDLPFLVGKFSTFRAYSESSIDAVLGEHKQLASEYAANTLESVVLLNRKSHFELRPLPIEAQVAPIFGTVVADFDLDGNEDLFVAQNFFAMRLGIPRLDAGRGLLLRGDGRGAFSPLTGEESGIMVYGEQRGAAAADFDGDGRPDLAVTQNGAETKLFRNNTSRRGLRVRITGAPENLDGIGCILRLKQGNRYGPARELHAGSGYWSQNSAVTVLALPGERTAPVDLQVQWPGGRVRLIRIPEDAQEYDVSLN